MKLPTLPAWWRQAIALMVLTCALAIAASASAETATAKILVFNGNKADTNLVQFKQAEYVGQCPGTAIVSGARTGRFVSSTTPPAPNRRVIIKNITEGLNGDPYPYTDREYDKSRYSEGFALFLGTSHDQQNFSLLEGENELEYEIKEGDRVLETGKFAVAVAVEDTGTFTRSVICEEKQSCHDEYRDCNGTRNRRQVCYPTTSCRCP